MHPAYGGVVGFTRAELDSYRGGALPDLAGPGLKLLLVGINPGLLTVAVQAHFARRGNRFYAALYRAGILGRVIDASAGFLPGDREYMIERGIGISSLVMKATARADELTSAELREGAALLTERVRMLHPNVVGMLGITAYRTGFGRPEAKVGPQDETVGGARLWVLPNPSGLNAHESVDSLAAAYRRVAIDAGIDVYDPPVVTPAAPER
jgi:TDG/mug DNA glycosylase family protein